MTTKPILLLILFAAGLQINSCDNPVQNKATNIVPPVLVAPPDGSSSLPINNIIFKWYGTANRLEIDYTPSFSPPVFSTAVSGNQYLLPPDILAHQQLYVWRVGITSGTVTHWSQSVFSFKTE